MNTLTTGDTKMQVVNLDITAPYLFEMSYIANPLKGDPAASKFAIYFNDKLIADVTPTDKNKHKISERVKGVVGKNTIKMLDKSTIPAYGAFVDDIALYEIH